MAVGVLDEQSKHQPFYPVYTGHSPVQSEIVQSKPVVSSCKNKTNLNTVPSAGKAFCYLHLDTSYPQKLCKLLPEL